MTPEKIVFARPFCLHRHHDVSGVSGDGIVAHGVEFPDGTVALRWVGSNPTSVVFHDNGIESVEAIHGHGGNTEVVWVAGVQMSRAVKAEAEANDRDHKWLDFHHAAWEADLRERIAQEIEALADEYRTHDEIDSMQGEVKDQLHAAVRIARGTDPGEGHPMTRPVRQPLLDVRRRGDRDRPLLHADDDIADAEVVTEGGES